VPLVEPARKRKSKVELAAKDRNSFTAKDTKDAEEQPTPCREGNNYQLKGAVSIGHRKPASMNDDRPA